ncbi:MAG: beta-ketoacyl-[Clostridia bacterium]|nr:beta-ketoacyl-[acyl-carrier-protein] synthase family protein [Clostridia bacterium]
MTHYPVFNNGRYEREKNLQSGDVLERVVVTGIGIVSAIGMGADRFWDNAVKGTSGITNVERFDTSYYRSAFGGEIKDFIPYVKRIDPQDYGLAAQYAASAARMAYEDAAADGIPDINTAGVFMGTAMGDCDEIMHDVSLGIMRFPAYKIPEAVSAEVGTEGDVQILPNACTAGNYGIIAAYEKIKNNKLRYAFAGGSDMMLESEFLGFSKLRSLAPSDCTPFDKNRTGMIIGEGAAVLFLEGLTSALARGARVYAEVIGWGASCDAYSMAMPIPDGSGLERAMSAAVRDAGIKYKDVDYICAHGTGTRTNDSAEAGVINRLFKRRLPVSSVKSMIGHAMGAASAIEAAVCCMAVKKDVIPPTTGFSTPDAECDIDCVPNEARHTVVRIAANNASAFGGNNTCVLFGKCE